MARYHGQDLPQTVLDAGGDDPQDLSSALYRCMDRLLPGQILEVISSTLLGGHDLRRWCQLNGHELLDIEDHGTLLVSWIRKDTHSNGSHAEG